MAQFFDTVSNFIATIYKYITHLLSGILAIPQLFDTIGGFIEGLFAFIPSEIFLFVMVGIFVCVLFHMIGR